MVCFWCVQGNIYGLAVGLSLLPCWDLMQLFHLQTSNGHHQSAHTASHTVPRTLSVKLLRWKRDLVPHQLLACL